MTFQNGKLDRSDVEIVKGLRKHGPRSLLKVAGYIGLPSSTIYDRFNGLYDYERNHPDIVSISPEINWPALGLQYRIAVVVGYADRESMIEASLTEMPHVLKWRKANSTSPIYLVEAIDPKDLESEETKTSTKNASIFEQNLRCMKSERVVAKSETFDVHDFAWPCSFTDYDKIIRTKTGWELGRLRKPIYYLQKTLTASSDFSVSRPYCIGFDRTDVVIISELMKNPSITFADLTKIVDITLQGVKYRYDNHLVRSRVLRGYGIDARKFEGETSQYSFFVEFSDKEMLCKFINASQDFTLVSRIGIMNDNRSLIVETEFPGANFVNIFEELEKEELIEFQKSEPLHFSRNSKSFTRSLDPVLFAGQKGI